MDRIERHLTDRVKRVLIGLRLTQSMDCIQGSLAVVNGRGRYARLLHFEPSEEQLPPHLVDALHELVAEGETGVLPLSEAAADLSEFQLLVADRLKRSAGKYVDRVLAIALSGPGLVRQDFDHRFSYSSLWDAARLAETTGISVIDQFPERDLICGGSGTGLMALPYWLLFADRNPRVATRTRMLIRAEKDFEIWIIPPSDGLDLLVPAIERHVFDEPAFLGELLSGIESRCNISIEELYSRGNSRTMSRDHWTSLADQDAIEAFLSKLSDEEIPGFVGSVFGWLGEQIAGLVSRHRCEEIMIASETVAAVTLQRELTRCLEDEVSVIDLKQRGFEAGDIPTVGTAILGMLHIDQMPASVPEITGATSQRILGQVTPGTASNYRQLLTCMSEYSPPAMKLRDAV